MKIKALVGISLVIFWIFIFTIIIVGLLTTQKTDQTISVLPQSNVKLTTQDVTKHNSSSDCWLIINAKVYDVTKFLFSHPGGEQIIVQYCGSDVTIAFRRHSSFAYSLLNNYYLGDLIK